MAKTYYYGHHNLRCCARTINLDIFAIGLP